MTKVLLLQALKLFTKEAVKDLRLPVQEQEEDNGIPPLPRPAEVYLMRLPELSAATQKAPYILHQVVTGTDMLQAARSVKNSLSAQSFKMQAQTLVRTGFCVYHPDGEAGGLALLDLMETLRCAMLKAGVVGKMFWLDLKEGLESRIYDIDGSYGTAPFYLGELLSVWNMPPMEFQFPPVIAGAPDLRKGD